MPIINPPPIFVNGNAGLVPDSDDSVTKFLRADGSFNVPPNSGGTWSLLDAMGNAVSDTTPTWSYSGAQTIIPFIGLASYKALYLITTLTLTSSGNILGNFSVDNGATWDNTSGNYIYTNDSGVTTLSTFFNLLNATGTTKWGSLFIPISNLPMGTARLFYTTMRSIGNFYANSMLPISGIRLNLAQNAASGSIYLYGLS